MRGNRAKQANYALPGLNENPPDSARFPGGFSFALKCKFPHRGLATVRCRSSARYGSPSRTPFLQVDHCNSTPQAPSANQTLQHLLSQEIRRDSIRPVTPTCPMRRNPVTVAT